MTKHSEEGWQELSYIILENSTLYILRFKTKQNIHRYFTLVNTFVSYRGIVSDSETPSCMYIFLMYITTGSKYIVHKDRFYNIRGNNSK